MTLDELLVWLTCTFLPSLGAALCLLFAARALIRRSTPESIAARATRIVAALMNAVLLSLGCGLVAGFAGSSYGGELAPGLSLVAGLVVGAVLGGGATFALLRGGFVAPVAPDPWGDGLVAAVALAWLFGAVTAVVGAVASVSLGMFTLAAAVMLVRPLALVFVAFHVAIAAGVVLSRHRTNGPRAWIVASVLNALALSLALLIAAFGPAAYERALDAAAESAGAVH